MNEYLILLYFLGGCCGRNNQCHNQRCCLPQRNCLQQNCCEPVCPEERRGGRNECCREECCCGEGGRNEFLGVSSQIFNLAGGLPYCPPQCPPQKPPCPPPCKPTCPPQNRGGRCNYYNEYNPRYRYW